MAFPSPHVHTVILRSMCGGIISHTVSTFKICKGRVCRFIEYQNFTGAKPTFRIYVPSWLPTLVRKSSYQTHCNFVSNFETRDFCRVLRNAPSNGPRGKLIGMYINISTCITDPHKPSKNNFLQGISNASLRQAIFSNHINIIYYANNVLYMYYILRKQLLW
jgi:hypothetical protein